MHTDLAITSQGRAVIQTVVLAGGMGTRLGSLTLDRPKPLVELAGRSILDHQLRILRKSGLERVLFLTGHKGEQIEAMFGNGAALGMQFEYLQEKEPLGTAGALRAAAHLLDETFFVVYGDLIFDMDMARLLAFHDAHKVRVTLAVHPNDHPFDSDLVEVDEAGYVHALHPKGTAQGCALHNLVNTGIFCMSRDFLGAIPADGSYDVALHVIPRVLEAGGSVAGYRTPEYIKDVGTPERLRAVEQHILSGEVARRRLPQPRPAVFLDRDGVIVEEVGEAYDPLSLRLLPGAAQAIRKLNKAGYLTIMVTNQPGIAKGFLTEADVDLAQAHIETLLGAEGAFLDAYFQCPHHPQKGFAGERPELKIACVCRKPGVGMIEQARALYSIDMKNSWLVGDRTVDLQTARNVELKSVMVRTGFGGKDGLFDDRADIVADDLAAAVDAITG